ncbi:ATP-binding cassette sub-family G member 20, partial [Caligus rogercresseyi]
RRVSFAAALIHDPELYILDEPTVGVDPRLRRNIWSHLIDLATLRKKTILITTHYIEEARQATTIGLMRNGRLLAEASPERLLSKFGGSTLEDVFLQLCISQDESHLLDPRHHRQTSSLAVGFKKIIGGILDSLTRKPIPQRQIEFPSTQSMLTNKPKTLSRLPLQRMMTSKDSISPSTLDPQS